MSDVLCLGEVLVDWVSSAPGCDLPEAQAFTKAPGGAPANTAVALARLGVATGFIGRVADDAFGRWLRKLLEDEGIDTSGTVVDQDAQTRMAYVVTAANGDRIMAEFTKISCADARLANEDINEKQIGNAQILHVGSISMVSASGNEATALAIDSAKRNDVLISFDPNVRLALWNNAENCLRRVEETLPKADLVKMSDEELHFLTGSKDAGAADALRRKYRVPVLLVTMGQDGTLLCCDDGRIVVPGFSINFVEATGAGDAFNAGILSALLEKMHGTAEKRKWLTTLSLANLGPIVKYANAVGALACTKLGAIPAMPNLNELERFLAEA